MAYWGEAMTFNHPIWMQQDLKAARDALNKLGPTPSARRAKAKTEREEGYFDALEILYGDGSKEERDFRYEDAMAKLYARYPDDVDAAAFYGLAILGTAHAGTRRHRVDEAAELSALPLVGLQAGAPDAPPRASPGEANRRMVRKQGHYLDGLRRG